MPAGRAPAAGPGSRASPPAAPTLAFGWLPPSVWLLGWISLLTDTASEAIYPLLPLFLTGTLGARPVLLGLVEGSAEAMASVLKVVSGRLADRLRRRRAFVIGGYTLSSLVRPLIGLATTWGHVFALRVSDRVGKGLRSAPRDAMLATMAPAHARGRVFGFHRAMDHAGAILGPLLASAFLWLVPGAYRALFLFTVLPGLAVVALTTRLPRDESAPAGAVVARPRTAPAWRELPRPLWSLLAVLGLFALGNSTDAYLLLRLSSLGASAAVVPLLWALLHVVKAATSLAGGALADRFGRRGVISGGWTIYAAVYAGFAVELDLRRAIALFLVYGVFFGMTEGVEKALVADLAPAEAGGTAFGLYNGVVGIGVLAASLLFGAVWEVLGAPVAFRLGAILAVAATVLLWVMVPAPRPARGA